MEEIREMEAHQETLRANGEEEKAEALQEYVDLLYETHSETLFFGL